MNTINLNMNTRQEVQPFGRFHRLNGWAVILLFFALVFLFLTVLGPMGLKTEYIKPMADFIEENNIEANAYYYTEVDEFIEAERHMREHLTLTPGSKH